MSQVLSFLIEEEKKRQRETLNLIASENYASPDVLHATGSILTNKYAEGTPGSRYYAGCQVIDKIENWAIEQAKKVFQADHVNLQPHSGSNANFAVYTSCLQPGDTLLGLSFTAGGHLTHGNKANFSGKFFKSITYGVERETELINYDELELLAATHKPRLIIAGASAYTRTLDYAKLAALAKKYNALLLADIAHIAGLIAAGVHPSPTDHADFVSGTTHKTLRGPRGGFVYTKAEYGAALDKALMPGTQGGPLMHVIAAKGIAFQEAQTTSFKEYQEQVVLNAQTMASTFQDLGYHIVSGGTDIHMFLIDLARTTRMSGKQAEEILQSCNITLNRNSVPFDQASPMITSGIRIGTAAITTRGMKEKEMIRIAHLIHDALIHKGDESVLQSIQNEIIHLCLEFPIPGY